MDRYVIIKKTIKTKFDEFMDHGRILYFGAPCGFGKTTVAFELLRGKKFELINGLESDGMLPEIKLNQNIVVIDDLQEFQEDEDLQKLTAESDIDLTLPARKPCIYYVVTSDVDSSNDFLASLFFTFLFIKLVRYADSRPNGKCDVDVFCFLDEFANIGAIPDFNKKISTVRSRGIALIPILQNIGQLKNRYPNDLWQEIIGNTDVRLGLGMTDILTAEYFCNMIGVSTVETESIKKSNSIEGEIEEYGQKNISTLKRNLLNIDEVMRVDSNKLIAILRGNKPMLLDKMIYTEHPLASKLKDYSILEYKPNWTKNMIKIKTKKQNISKEEKKEKNKQQLSFDNF